MTERKDDPADVWGELDTTEESRKRREAIQKKGVRFDWVLGLLLAAVSLLFIVCGGVVTLFHEGNGSVMGLRAAGIGVVGLIIACKLVLGKR